MTARGRVSPGQSVGTLTISGNYTQAITGQLNIEINGKGSSDLLHVSSSAILAGALNVVLSGYAPRAGETFTILTAANVNGSFSAISGSAPWPGLGWQAQYGSSSVSLVVTGRPQLASYDTYASYHNLGAGSFLLDANNNGQPNLLEYALGNSPTGNVWRSGNSIGASNGWFQLCFPRNADATDINYYVEAATMLENGGDWNCILSNVNVSGWLGPATFTESGASNGIIEVVVTDVPTNTPSRFLRLRVSKP